MNAVQKIWKFICTLCSYAFYTCKVRKVDFFNYKRLIYPNYAAPWGFSSVMMYGNWRAVAQLKGSRFRFASEYLEHGISFYNSTETAEYLGYPNRKGIRTIYTYGEFRKSVLEKYLQEKNLNRNVVAIGPYILGAKHFHNLDSLAKIKAKYGKILLVYTSHSFESMTANYESSELATAINTIRKNFDSVFVSMYWKDILDKPHEVALYEQQGFTVVCSGHRSDPKFLSRQKDLMHLADMIMTNDVGSHIGYAICMNKPVYYFSHEVHNTEISLDNSDGGKDFYRQKCAELFGTFSFKITPEQRKMVEYVWGKW